MIVNNIYIMYSLIRSQYKIGESADVERRLQEIKRGSAGGDKSTILIDYFPITIDMIPHRSMKGVDHVFHSCAGGVAVTDATDIEWFDISKKDAYEIIIKGFDKLEKDKEKYLLNKYGRVLNRRLNKIFHKYISFTKSEFEIKMPKFALFLEKGLVRKYSKFYTIEPNQKALTKIFTIHYKSVLNNLPFYTNLFGKHFVLKGIIQIVKYKENSLKEEDIESIAGYIRGAKSFIELERRRLNYKLRPIRFHKNVKYDLKYNEMLLLEYKHLLALDYFLNSKKIDKYSVNDLSKDFFN